MKIIIPINKKLPNPQSVKKLVTLARHQKRDAERIR